MTFCFLVYVKVAGEYKDLDRIYPKIYQVDKSYMAVERTASMRFLGLAGLKNEGAPTVFDNQAGERYIYNQYHKEIGLGYAFTRRMVDDNLYKRQWRPSNLGLQKSFNQTKEIYGATPLNTATTYDPIGAWRPAAAVLAQPSDRRRGGSESLHGRHGPQRGVAPQCARPRSEASSATTLASACRRGRSA